MPSVHRHDLHPLLRERNIHVVGQFAQERQRLPHDIHILDSNLHATNRELLKLSDELVHFYTGVYTCLWYIYVRCVDMLTCPCEVTHQAP
ncbi:hypothetical protein ATCV1_z532R [Acanthocystis turfacea chlorella virus 1]|uniref:Uncharacterized protein z532R n=1 Tax=Chlorovirus heliozoae TaxID=322019 RepID=A7K9E2_9PHYC|nr:hypothetical protein ATCV1_z532R [Acanthocystis turfacea chlorella virus 1]ABT16666.1 hypothetical protein ATCV1_z532R [Acanthocystis turfacea chlorella virus 1]